MKNKKLLNDIILISALIIIITLGFIFLTPKNSGDFAVVIINGTETARYLLSENLEIDITSGGTNHLVISEGTARITSADCPNGVCVNSGAIKNAGETIVCLPHNLIIKIVSE